MLKIISLLIVFIALPFLAGARSFIFVRRTFTAEGYRFMITLMFAAGAIAIQSARETALIHAFVAFLAGVGVMLAASRFESGNGDRASGHVRALFLASTRRVSRRLSQFNSR